MAPSASGAWMAQTDSAEVDRAMHRAGRLLGVRARTEHEMRNRLAGAGFEPAVVGRVIQRLRELRLIDDESFAGQWIEERSRSKGLAPAALVTELEAKGIKRAAAEAAVGEAGLDEQAGATDLARRLASKLCEGSLEAQVRRLEARLLRRGYSPEVVETAVRAALPPEGWD